LEHLHFRVQGMRESGDPHVDARALLSPHITEEMKKDFFTAEDPAAKHEVAYAAPRFMDQSTLDEIMSAWSMQPAPEQHSGTPPPDIGGAEPPEGQLRGFPDVEEHYDAGRVSPPRVLLADGNAGRMPSPPQGSRSHAGSREHRGGVVASRRIQGAAPQVPQQRSRPFDKRVASQLPASLQVAQHKALALLESLQSSNPAAEGRIRRGRETRPPRASASHRRYGGGHGRGAK